MKTTYALKEVKKHETTELKRCWLTVSIRFFFRCFKSNHPSSMSLLGKYPCDNITAPTYLSFTTATSTALISIVASLGNVLVILAVLLNPNKDLKSPFNYFIANLSFADLVVGLLSAPMSTVYSIVEGIGKVKKYEHFEIALQFTYFAPCTASLLSLAALALDRYVAIVYPLIYRTRLNPVRAFIVSVVIWIVSSALFMIYYALGYNRFRFIFANTAVATALAVLIFTNAKIFKFLRRQVDQWDSIHDSSVENMAKKRNMEWEKKITKTLVIVLLLFLACYLPSCICIYIINFCTNCNCEFIHWVRDIQYVLVMANSGLNPFVYAWRLQNFRKAFKSILKCHVCVHLLRSTSASTVISDATSGDADAVKIELKLNN